MCWFSSVDFLQPWQLAALPLEGETNGGLANRGRAVTLSWEADQSLLPSIYFVDDGRSYCTVRSTALYYLSK